MLRTLPLLLVLLAAPAFAQSPVAGDWAGEIDVSELMPNVGTLPLIFHITDGDSLAATMDSPEQGAFGLPAESVAYDPEFRSLQLVLQGITVVGTLADDGSRIDGSFAQGPRTFDLVLTPYEAPAETADARPKARPKARGDYSGAWLGIMDIPGGGQMRLTFTLAHGEQGGYTAVLDAPGQAENLSLGPIEVHGKDVTINIMGQASFTGEMADDETAMVGTFTQGTQKLPMTLTRQ